MGKRSSEYGRHHRRNSAGLEFFEWFIALIAALGIALFLHFLVFQLIRVDGPSMQPTLYTDERLFCTPATYLLREPVRGEIVITSYPNRGRDHFVKRVIGLEGERVAIHDGQVYINDAPLDEPYIRETILYTMEEITVPEGHVFVLGDNRNDSSDSHDARVGCLPLTRLQAKAHVIIWPLDRIRLLTTPSYDALS